MLTKIELLIIFFFVIFLVTCSFSQTQETIESKIRSARSQRSFVRLIGD